MTEFAKSALRYHEHPVPGKISIEITKPASTPADLALAYSPGVAEPVKAIARCPEDVCRYTGKGNLVAIITNGSAILGLGNLGPLASKPVMEGKALSNVKIVCLGAGAAACATAGHARTLDDALKSPVPAELLALYGLKQLSFGRDYIIPMPLDPRLLTQVAPAVAQAAQLSGVSRLQAFRAVRSAGPMSLG